MRAVISRSLQIYEKITKFQSIAIEKYRTAKSKCTQTTFEWIQSSSRRSTVVLWAIPTVFWPRMLEAGSPHMREWHASRNLGLRKKEWLWNLDLMWTFGRCSTHLLKSINSSRCHHFLPYIAELVHIEGGQMKQNLGLTGASRLFPAILLMLRPGKSASSFY